MNVVKYLAQIDKIDQMIENKQAEVQRWKDIATSTSAGISGERVSSSGNHDTMANAVCTYLDIEDEEITALKQKRAAILRTIEQLPADEYDLIHKVYVQKLTLKDVAYMRKKSYSWATTTHKKAKADLQKILNKRSEQ